MKWTRRAEDKLVEIGFVVPQEASRYIRGLAEIVATRNQHKSVGVPQVKSAYRHWYHFEREKKG